MNETPAGGRLRGGAAVPAPEHRPPHGRRPRARAWGSTILGLCLLAAACFGGPDRAPADRGSPAAIPTTPSPGPTAGIGGPDPQSAVAVERAYQQFWVTAQTVDRQPPERWREVLSAVAAEPLLDQLLDGLAGQRKKGVVMYGTVTPRPTIAQIAGGRATVMDCQDASRSGELDGATGAIQRVGTARTPFAAVLRYDAQTRRWLVTEARYLPEPC